MSVHQGRADITVPLAVIRRSLRATKVTLAPTDDSALRMNR
jgi:hypothetical protein